MRRHRSTGVMAGLVALQVAAAAGSAQADVASDDACWGMLNELAAAAVFADIADDKLESIYVLLDQLQDQCEAHDYAEANKSIKAIEAVVGK